MLRLNIPAMYDLLERENRETLRHDNTIVDTIDSCRGLLRENSPHGSSAEVLRGYFEEICIPVLSALRIGGALIRELNGRFSSLIGSVFPDISAKVLDEEELSGMIGAFNTAIERLIAFTESAPEAAPFFSSSLTCMKGLRDAADELLAAFLGFSEETEGFFTEAGAYIAEIRNIAATYSSVSFGQDEEGMLFFRIGEGEPCYDAASLRQAFSRTLGTLGSHNGLFELECLKNAPSFAPIASSVRTITKKMTVGEASAFGLFAYGDDSVKEVLSKDPQVIYAEDYADGRDIPGHAVALSRMGLRDGDISDVAYVFGEEDLDHAVDCSGFVRSLFGLFGFSFDGNANAFATNTSATNGTTCTAVPLDELKPGDIVARLSPGGHGHVGIYIGNGQYINASGGSANYDMAHAGTGVTISPIPTGDNVYAWRVDGLVEKEDAASLWGKMQDAVDSCTGALALNPLYVSALYETAHPDEADCFDSLNEGLRGLPVEDRLGVKNTLYGQDEDGASVFEENDCKRIVAKSLGNGISCRVSESGQTRVLPDSHNAGDRSCVVEISEADLANGRQDGYYEVYRAIGNGVDISGKSISPSGQVWSDIARSGMTISEAAKNDSNCFSQWCAGQSVGTPYGSRMNAQALDALLSGSAPTSPLPGTDPGLEGNHAYFADYFAEEIRGKANDTNSYTPQTDAHMRHILNDILQAYGG